MSATSKRSGGPGPDPDVILLWAAVGLVLSAAALFTGAVHVAARVDATRHELPANPITLISDLAKGTVALPPSTWTVLIVMVVVLVALAVGVLLAVRGVRGRRSRVDRAARRMGRGADLAALSRKGVQVTARRLGVRAPGLAIGRAIAGGQMLYQSWEDVAVDIWGPRVGKTTSRAIPAILQAPGAVLATSNKRDLLDATRGLRASSGEVWVFDPQGIAGERPDWWWNPLSYVTSEVRASILADVFATAGRDPGARTDAYFEPAAQDLLANLLLAAALSRRPVTQVYLWLTAPTDDEPVSVLSEHGYPLLAAALQAVINAPEKQRGGVFGTAQQIASFLTNREAMRWVTPSGGATRELDVGEFVASTQTMYSLSKEGRGSAGPLVTALTVAICEAAEDLAKRSPGGRLAVPMVAVLDEAANVCRWRELPSLYSHYGSRGICLMTILQSWSQGVEVWGRDGMRKLWSAANVKVYGGGVSEVEFLSEISQLIGDFDLHSTSRTYSPGRGGGTSTNHSVRRERILDVADLTALPRGRIVVFASGAPGTLARPIPWMDGPHAREVRESIARHDPTAPVAVPQDVLAGESIQADTSPADNPSARVGGLPG